MNTAKQRERAEQAENCKNVRYFEKQAKRWALTKKGASIVNNYSYTENKNLKILCFRDMTEEWLEFVFCTETALKMGKVYQRLISDTLQPGENYVDGIIRVYNNDICEVIDNYNGSAFYEPSYVIARAYQNGGF